jgi:hypothetical protein
MNIDAVHAALVDFAKKHKADFAYIGSRESQLLELATIVAVDLHYRSNGYTTTIKSPEKSGAFVVKTSTRGHPAKYSKIIMEKEGEISEAHMNLMVRGAHDGGIYCVDVGIVKSGIVPEQVDTKEKWRCAPNGSLLSFAETKRLTVYPMLLAQFVGIVHEIKPEFLRSPVPEGFGQSSNLPPTLIALGHFSGTSKSIVDAYKPRSITVCIAENFDVRLAMHRKGATKSPLYWDAPAVAGLLTEGDLQEPASAIVANAVVTL